MQGYFSDDGTPMDISSIKMPELCRKCKKNGIESEEIACNLNRIDQREDVDSGKEF